MSLLLLFGGGGTPPVPEVLVTPTSTQVRPEVLCEIDYADPTGAFAGLDESGYFIRAQIDRGRSTELDQQQAGTATITLSNITGRFDPANRSSVLYPNVVPMRRVKLSASVDGAAKAFTARRSHVKGLDVVRGGTVAYPLFTGFIESWHQTWAQSNGDAQVVIHAVDGFGAANLAEFVWGARYTGTDTFVCGTPSGTNVVPQFGPPLIPDDLTGTRIGRVLDCLGWPASERSLDPGTVTVWGSDTSVGGTQNIPVNSNALTHLLDAAETEGGWLFVDGAGRFRFIDRTHEPVLDPLDVYGGGVGELPYRDIEAPFDTSRLWNDITVGTNSNLAATISAADQASIDAAYTRSKSFSILATGSPTLFARLIELLVRYRRPYIRIPRLEMTPTSAGAYRALLGKELQDKVRVRKRPLLADMIEQDSRIEGISIDIPGGTSWTVTWQLSNMDVNLLSSAQASPEDTLSGWVAETNCAVGLGNGLIGGDGLGLTATGAGDMAARTSPTDQIVVEVGKHYRATAYFRPNATVRTVRVEIDWRDSGGSSISSSVGAGITEVLTDWTQATVDGVAPASATSAVVRVKVLAAAAAEVHAVDFITLTRS